MGSPFCIWEVSRLLPVVCALVCLSTGTVRKSKPSHAFGVLPRGSGLHCRRQRGIGGRPPPRAFINTEVTAISKHLDIMSFPFKEPGMGSRPGNDIIQSSD